MSYTVVGTPSGTQRRWYDDKTYRSMLLEEAAQAVYEMTHPDAPVGTEAWRTWWARLGCPDLRARRRSLAMTQAAEAAKRRYEGPDEVPF